MKDFTYLYILKLKNQFGPFFENWSVFFNRPIFMPKPVRMIIHGSACVGKSATIRAIATQAEHILTCVGDDPDCPKVLLCAFTAKAANIIGGKTFHSASSFKIETSVCHMSPKTRVKLRHHYANLKLIIIDEVSLVGADMLYRMHKKLCEILDMDEKRQPFGNINVVLIYYNFHQ